MKRSTPRRQGWHTGVLSSSVGCTYWVNGTPRAYIHPSTKADAKPYAGRVYYSAEPPRYFASLEEAKIMLEAMTHLEGD